MPQCSRVRPGLSKPQRSGVPAWSMALVSTLPDNLAE